MRFGPAFNRVSSVWRFLSLLLPLETCAYGRWSTKEFRHFLFNARGSLSELETQIVIADKLEYVSGKQLNALSAEATQVGRSLTGLLNSLATSAA